MKQFLRKSLLSIIALAVFGSAHAQVKVKFDLPAQPLADSLKAVANQTSTNVLFDLKLVTGYNAPALKAELTPSQAIEKLLRGTGLTREIVNEHTIVLSQEGRPTAALEIPPEQGDSNTLGMRLAKASSNGQQDETAQQSSDGGQERSAGVQEIVVTAQKREENLSEVPVPVSALNANELTGNLNLLRDYYARVPNLNLTPGAQSAQVLSIRGITTGRGNPVVGVMIDGVPFGSSSGLGGGEVVPDIDPGNLERLEVLRGPQGTLYGASSMGGLLNFVTRKPSMSGFSGRVQLSGASVEGSSDIGHTIRGSANIPVSDTIALRVSGFHRHDAGYIDNLQAGRSDVNSADAGGGHLTALWQASDAWSVRVSALMQQIDGDGAAEVHSALGDMKQQTIIGTGWYERKVEAYDATITGNLGSAVFNSITGYSENGYSGSSDLSYLYGGLVGPLFGVTGAELVNSNRTEKFSQELRLTAPLSSRVDVLLGAFYTDEDSFIKQTILAENPATGAIGGRYLFLEVPTTYQDTAVFADLTVKMTDRFDVQFGGRQSWLKQTFSQTTINDQNVTTLSPRSSNSADIFTYLVTPRLRITPDVMAYARFASGYRAGGANAGLDTPPTYQPDETRNYELGLKGLFLGGVLTLDASVYQIDWDGIQLNVRPGAVSYTTNGGDAQSRGVELSFGIRPVGGLSISGSAVYSDATLTEDFPTAARVIAFGSKGDRLPFSSEWSGNLNLRHDFSTGSSYTPFVSANVSYVGDRYGIFQRATTPARERFEAYTKIDASVGVTVREWDVNAFVNNVSDERGELWGGIGAVPPFAYWYIQPRTFGLSISRDF